MLASRLSASQKHDCRSLPSFEMYRFVVRVSLDISATLPKAAISVSVSMILFICSVVFPHGNVNLLMDSLRSFICNDAR